MTIEDLKAFFKELGYNWTGKIDTCCQSTNGLYEPKTYEEIVDLSTRHETGVSFLFLTAKGVHGEYYRVLPDLFMHYYEYDIGQDFVTMPGKNYTNKWLKFQKALQTKSNL